MYVGVVNHKTKDFDWLTKIRKSQRKWKERSIATSTDQDKRGSETDANGKVIWRKMIRTTVTSEPFRIICVQKDNVILSIIGAQNAL